jgi:hypothetical protein
LIRLLIRPLLLRLLVLLLLPVTPHTADRGAAKGADGGTFPGIARNRPDAETHEPTTHSSLCGTT